MEPVIPCMDSTREFIVNEDDLVDCHWVARENTAYRCSKGKGSVATNCPATCGTCDVCTDAKKPFMTEGKGIHTCKWVGRTGLAGLYPKRCKFVGDKSTCRKTCGQCPPDDAPVCQDSSATFYVNEIPRTCGWVAGAPETKCKRGKVDSHCPVTCGTCGDGVKNSGATFEVKGLTAQGDKNNYRTCKWVSDKSTNMRCAMIDKDCGVSTCPEFCTGCPE